MSLTVQSIKDGKVDMQLEGAALLATDPDPAKAARGFDVKLLGRLAYNESKKTFERFDLVAIGEHWGEGRYTPGARVGHTPLGLAFNLASSDSPANAVPPEGAKNWWDYMHAN